jgi:hypothetical protein
MRNCLHTGSRLTCVYNCERLLFFLPYRGGFVVVVGAPFFVISKCSIRFGLICLLCRLIVTVADGTIGKEEEENSYFIFCWKLRFAFHHDSRSLTCGLVVAVGVGVSFYDTVRQSRGPPLLSSPVIIVQPNLLPFYLFLLFPFSFTTANTEN